MAAYIIGFSVFAIIIGYYIIVKKLLSTYGIDVDKELNKPSLKDQAISTLDSDWKSDNSHLSRKEQGVTSPISPIVTQPNDNIGNPLYSNTINDYFDFGRD